ncbi:MAG: DNA adenine methylase [Patescibacteria group bacterium]
MKPRRNGGTDGTGQPKAPFPYFGGKSKIASVVWEYLGDVKHYIEPFFGSGAVLLLRPDHDPARHVETVNDKDCNVANVWRAMQFQPDETARWCDWPVNHADLSARKAAIIRNEGRLRENLIADPEWCDPKMAGYWIWAASCWIGSGLTCPNAIPSLSKAGMGVHAIGQIPHLSDAGKGIYSWFRALSERLRRVRVVCGDWTQVCGGNWQDGMGTVGIFFDPPYSSEKRDKSLYAEESMTVATDVAAWCLERGNRCSYRIVLAGYDDGHSCLRDAGWLGHRWSAGGGYGNRRKENTNRHREMLFVSPHCIVDQQQDFITGRLTVV